MSIDVVVGLQWGDEGKGKLIDVLAPQADYVVRFQGGNNAGHTVVVGNESFVLQLLPSGIVGCSGSCLIGPGVVVDLNVLQSEIQRLEQQGKSCDQLYIDPRAHIIMPYHIQIDRLKEEQKGEQKIGTTIRGIGPCYIDKFDRIGLRIGDLLDPQVLKGKLQYVLGIKNQELKMYGAQPLSFELLYEEMLMLAQLFTPRIKDVQSLINEENKLGKKILLEGAQALMLDIDYGTYPYVTSSSPSAGGACVGAGIGPTNINRIYGVCKAYTTRVGEGPFPTQLDDEVGDYIREKGHEYGTNTGRKRRCGWLDLVLAKYAININGVTDLVITKLDVLDELETIKVAIGYKYNGEIITTPPYDLADDNLEVVYQELPGWMCDTSRINNYEDLPQNTKNYIQFIKDYLQTDIYLVSVGPEREQNIYIK